MAQTGNQAKSTVGTEMVTHVHSTLESGTTVGAQATAGPKPHTVTSQGHAAESTAHRVNPARTRLGRVSGKWFPEGCRPWGSGSHTTVGLGFWPGTL